jgi:periplasmic divalent cation tolerance protein
MMGRMADDRAALVLTTVGSADDASRLSRLLVEERLAGCVSVTAVASTYRWEGKVVEEGEWLLLVKTAPARVEALRQRLLAEHPYDVPELLVLDASGVPEPYDHWLEESTR